MYGRFRQCDQYSVCPARTARVTTFNDMLTYVSRDPSHWMLPMTALERSVYGRKTKISPPLAKFEVLHTILEPGKPDAILAARGPSIAIVTSGARVHFEVEHDSARSPARWYSVCCARERGEGQLCWRR